MNSDMNSFMYEGGPLDGARDEIDELTESKDN